MNHEDKRSLRKLKREIKRAGTKRSRRLLKKELHERPEDAPYSAVDHGKDSSEGFNGMDRDATRRRTDKFSHGEPGASATGGQGVSEPEA